MFPERGKKILKKILSSAWACQLIASWGVKAITRVFTTHNYIHSASEVCISRGLENLSLPRDSYFLAELALVKISIARFTTVFASFLHKRILDLQNLRLLLRNINYLIENIKKFNAESWLIKINWRQFELILKILI